MSAHKRSNLAFFCLLDCAFRTTTQKYFVVLDFRNILKIDKPVDLLRKQGR